MTTLDSLSPAESSMDDSSNNPNNPQILTTTTTTSNKRSRRTATDVAAVDSTDESNSGEVWRNFTDNFRQVQSVLDRNRVLIQQVNENHQSKIHENMVKNVALIQEINGNISKVVSLYSNLSTNFSTVFRERNEAAEDDEKGKNMED